jgi:thiosulfate/3-mercaptopyruvate sulfurtransferase
MGGVVSTQWLADNLERTNLRILDLRGTFGPYEESHIPGAQSLNVETLRMTRNGFPCQMMPLELLSGVFGELGIGSRTDVVVYATRPGDHLSATYAAWTLMVTGHDNTFVLDGGLSAWEREGRLVVREYPSIKHATYTAKMQEDDFADWRYVKKRLRDQDVVLVDTRARSMYLGETGPTMRLGRIPGAVLHNYVWDYDRDGTYQPEERLRAGYERAGITPDKEVITYCVTGREASAAWFALKHILGYPRVRLYQASLTEWAAKPDLPMETGEPGRETPRLRKAA